MAALLNDQLGGSAGIHVGAFVLSQEEERKTKKGDNSFRRVTLVAGDQTVKWMVFADRETGVVPSFESFEIVRIKADKIDVSGDSLTIFGASC